METFDYNGYLSLIDFALRLTLLFAFQKLYLRGGRLSKIKHNSSTYFYVGFVLVLYCVFGWSEYDFYHYQRAYEVIKTTHEFRFEPIYSWLVLQTNNFYQWRLIIWGTATLLCLLTISRLRLRIDVAAVIISLLFLPVLSEFRNSLGFVICFYGFSFIIKPGNNRFLSKILGCVIIFSSIFFHKSMIFTVILLLLSRIRISKKIVQFSLCLFPLAVIVLDFILSYISTSTFNSADNLGTVNSMIGYIEANRNTSTTIGAIMAIVDYIIVLLPMCLLVNKIVYHRFPIPKYISSLFSYAYFLTYIAFCFAFNGSSFWLYQRFLYMGYFPLTLVLTYFYSNSIPSKFSRFVLLTSLCYMFFEQFMLFYTWEIK